MVLPRPAGLHPEGPHWQRVLYLLPWSVTVGLLRAPCGEGKRDVSGCGCSWRGSLTRRSHLGADGSGVGVKLGGPPSTALPQQGAADEGKRHGQCRVLIVRGHVGDALATVAHLVSGSDVEGGVVGGAGGAETPLPCGGFGRWLGGSGLLRRRHGQWRDDRAIQGGDAAGIAGKVLLRDGGAVRPILLTAVVLDRGGDNTKVKHFFSIVLLRLTCCIYVLTMQIEQTGSTPKQDALKD